MDTDTITRGEYESRQAEMTARMAKIETELSTSYKLITEENKALRDDIQQKFDDLHEAISKGQISTLKLMALCIVNFVIGGGLVEIVSMISRIK